MALVFCTGFEHGVNNTTSLVKGNAGNKFADFLNITPAITSSTPRTGGFCLELSMAAQTERIQWDANSLGSAASTMVWSFGLYFPSAIPTADCVLSYIITTNPTYDLALLFRNSDDKLIINTTTTAGTSAVSSITVAADTWYWIDLRFSISGTAWTVDWAIDTTAQTQFTITAGGTYTSDTVALGTPGSATYTARYDDLVISKTSGDYPLGEHQVRLLTADTGGTTAEIGTANATSRMVTNSALDATHNSAQILTALTEGPPPTFGASASGVGQRTSGAGNAVGIPMTTYTLAGGETVSGLRLTIPGWAATATTATLGFRTYNGTTETTLQAGTVDPNFDADTAAPAWYCKMATLADFDTQAELDAFVVRIGYSTDVNPVIGAHAVYAELAVKESTSTPVTLTDTAAGADAASVAAAVPRTDTAVAADVLSISSAFALADTAVAADALALVKNVPVALSDTAVASDVLAPPGNAVSLTDTAVAVDVLTITATVALADTAVAADARAVAAAVLLADTAVAAETLAAGVPVSFTDTATAADALTVTVTVPLTDTAVAADVLLVLIPITLADTAAASDSLLIPPPSVTDLALWWRGDDLFGLSDGAGISSWTSLAGTSVASQATGGFQPTKQTVSGETVVRFDGTDDRLLANGDALTVIQNASAATVFVRIKTTSTGGVFIGFGGAVAVGNHRLAMRAFSGYNFAGRRLDADSLQGVGTQAVNTSAVVVLAGIVDWSTASIDLFVDGVPRGSRTPFQTAGLTSNTPSLATAIGSGASEDTFDAGDIYEIIVYDRVLTSLERRLIEQYLGVSPLVVGFDEDGTATEAITITVAAPLAETATATEFLSTPFNQADPNQAPIQIPGFFIDPESASVQLMGSSEVLIVKALLETATAAEALTATIAAPLAETAAASDGLVVTAAVPLSDTSAAFEAMVAGVPIAFTDTASATDALAVTVPTALAETATANDALTITVSVALTDTATAAETFTAGVPISFTDTAAATDNLTVTVAAPLAETAVAADALAVSVPIILTDTAVATDLLARTITVALADTAIATDARTVAAAVPLAETVVSADALALSIAVTLADTTTTTELLIQEAVLLFEGSITGATQTGPGISGTTKTGSGITGGNNPGASLTGSVR